MARAILKRPVMKRLLSLKEFVGNFADALKSVDSEHLTHKKFRPGIGPYGEREAVRAVLSKLQSTKPSIYSNARIQRDPDLIIPGQWALEIKIARPFGDNGLLAEHWSENLLHPYPGNTSSLGDCVKLLGLRVSESKAVVIIGYEHTPARVPLDPAIRGFEMLAKEIMRLRLSPRVEELRVSLVHPVHQQLRVFAYEVLGTMATR